MYFYGGNIDYQYRDIRGIVEYNVLNDFQILWGEDPGIQLCPTFVGLHKGDFMDTPTLIAAIENRVNDFRGRDARAVAVLTDDELVVTVQDWFGPERNALAKEARLVFKTIDYGEFKTLFEAYGSRVDYGLGDTEWYTTIQYLVGVREDLPKYVKDFIRAQA